MRQRSRGLAAVAAAICMLSAASASEPASRRVDAGHGLSIVVPGGWRVLHRSFTPCINPIERFSLISGRQMLMVQERLAPVSSELTPRPRYFAVEGPPTPLECCSIRGRSGWVLHFSDHGRAFYAYLYPSGSSADALLQVLDSFRASKRQPETPAL
jgi:hypothetical protein